MIPPKQCKAKLSEKLLLNDRFIQFTFEWTEPHQVTFAAGQYMSILLPDSQMRRSYSICSNPAKEHGFDLMLDIAPNGIGVKYLQSLEFGQEISCLCPLGVFTVPETVTGPLHFIATGSGIAPYRSMVLDQLQNKKNTQPIMLYWGMREPNMIFWEDEFAELMQAFPNFQFHPVISQAPEDWPLCRGHVTDCLSTHALLPNTHYFACGSEKMVTDVLTLLQTKGVPKEQLHREKFY